MSRAVFTFRPSYLSGGLIALAGLLLAWLLPGFLPAWMSSAAIWASRSMRVVQLVAALLRSGWLLRTIR